MEKLLNLKEPQVSMGRSSNREENVPEGPKSRLHVGKKLWPMPRAEGPTWQLYGGKCGV
jgi:hypothetical protein